MSEGNGLFIEQEEESTSSMSNSLRAKMRASEEQRENET